MGTGVRDQGTGVRRQKMHRIMALGTAQDVRI
jgi:hypothetical protein